MDLSFLFLQFAQFMIVIKELMKKMETEHSHYLNQVAKMEEQTRYVYIRRFNCLWCWLAGCLVGRSVGSSECCTIVHVHNALLQ